MKRIWILPVLLVVGFALYLYGQSQPTDLQKAVSSGEIIRLHVVAASDDEYDQQTKLIVRDAILDYFADDALACRDTAGMERSIARNLSAIEHVASAAAQSNGYGGNVSASFGQYAFPDRIYAGESVPAGEYKALRVVLGDGNGANWWCVMYPPLCFSGEDAIPPGEKVDVQFESSIAKWLRSLRKSE